MRVCLISADFPPTETGDASHALYVARHLARRGVDVHVLTTAGNGEFRSPEFKVCPWVRRWSWRGLPTLVRFLKGRTPDAVLLLFVGRMYNHHPMITFLPTVAKAAAPGCVVVTQFEHTGSRTWEARLPTRLVRRAVARWAGAAGADYEYGTLLRDSDRLIFLTDGHREELARVSPAVQAKSLLIPPPPMMTFCADEPAAARRRGRAELGLGPDDFVLCYYGFVYPGKGVDTLLRAFRLVAGERPDARLVIAGGCVQEAHAPDANAWSAGYMGEVRRLSEQLGLAAKVIWTGSCQPDTEKASLCLRAADVAVLPFDAGVYLNNSTFAAAVAHGLPVITTTRPNLESPFVHDENVYLCPPKDPEALASAVRRLMNEPDLRQRLCDGALRLAAECFDWDRAIDRTIAALKGQIGGKSERETAAAPETASC